MDPGASGPDSPRALLLVFAAPSHTSDKEVKEVESTLDPPRKKFPSFISAGALVHLIVTVKTIFSKNVAPFVSKL